MGPEQSRAEQSRTEVDFYVVSLNESNERRDARCLGPRFRKQAVLLAQALSLEGSGSDNVNTVLCLVNKLMRTDNLPDPKPEACRNNLLSIPMFHQGILIECQSSLQLID